MLWWFLSLFTLFSGLQSISAQSNASCLPYYTWTFNLQKKTPCDVVSSLLAVCNHGSFPVDALPDSTHYLGPSMANTNPCQCNTVTYSLMSACAACQGRTYLSWSTWSTNCATVYSNSYPEPIPSGTSVPGWAYLDVEANDTFDQSRAKDNANLTESTAIPSPTSHSITASSQAAITTSGPVSTLASVSSTATAAADSPSSMLNAHANAVGGSVVGGLFGLMILCSILLWVTRRRRRPRGSPLEAPSESSSKDGEPWAGQGPYMAEIPLNHQSPSDLSSLSASSLLTIPVRSAAQSNVSEAGKSMSGVRFQV